MKIILYENDLKALLNKHFDVSDGMAAYEIHIKESLAAYTERVGEKNRVMPLQTIGQSAVNGDLKITTYLYK